jgi:hypothetical protein
MIVTFGQTYTGSITGTVKDPTGAVVPNANVTITDVGKGFNYTAITDNNGIFTVRNLPPATYTEKVEAPGFTPYERQNIVLQVNSNVEASADLALVSTGQTVTVNEAGAAQLQTEDATTGQTINRTLINDLPLINRQVFDLAYLSPGVSQPPGGTYGNASFGNNFVSNGGRNAQADILIDGISSTSYEQNTGFITPLYTPSVEAVQEFRIQQSNFSAEIGFSSGTVVNLVTRSGTNDVHGSLYDFLRNTDLNANSFFNNRNGFPRTSYQRNNFGGTVGGPIVKNKLFYFFDYDGIREISPSTGTFGVPSLAERNGNFGELCGDKGGTFSPQGLCSVAAGQLWDPYSAVQNNNYGSGGLRTQLVPFNNLANYASANLVGSTAIASNVRGNLINPITQKVMSFYPLPNTGGIPGTTSYNPYSNFYAAGKNVNNNNQYDLKLDTRFTDNDQLSVRFSQQWGNSQIGNLFGNALDAYTQGPTNGITYSGAVNYNHIFTPRTLLTVTVGYDHNFVNTAGLASQYPNVTLESLGFSITAANQLRQSGFNALPAFNLDQYSKENGNASIGGQPYAGLIYGRDVYHFLGSVGHTAGGHDLHMGAEFRVHRINFAQFGEPAGLFAFGQGGTSQYQSVGGDSMATFLTGFANNWSAYENPVTPATQNLQYGGFIQDNWHVNDRLTLNLGVRYDIDKPRTERYNQMSFFDPSAPSPLAGVPGVPSTGSLEYVGQNGFGRSPYQTYYGAVGPRFGFAYRVGENWTVRGGYGLYYDPSKYGAAGTGSGGAGFLGYTSQPSFANYNNTYNYIPNLVVGQPLSIPPKTGNSLGVNTNLGNSLNGIPIYNFTTLPQEQSWSFGIQRQLPFQILADFEYVGRKGTHLYLGGDNYSLNHLPESAADAFRANPSAFLPNVPTPTALTNAVKARTPAYANGFWGGTWPAYNAYLPYPQYPLGVYGSSGLQNVDPPIGNSIYHAFQMRLDKRMTNGLQFLFTYTAQKSIDNSSIAGSNVYVDGYSGSTLAQIQDPNNLRLERSLSAFDISQVAQFTALYQLPFGRGKAFGANWNRLIDSVLGGWQVNGIYRWDTGLPLLLFLNGGVSLPTYGGQRPNLPYQLITSGTINPDVSYFANGPTSANLALWTPAPYYDGNAPKVLPNVRQQGTNNVSASLFKQFAFTERYKLELRGEAFNLLNRVQFGAPATTVGLTNFGFITSQANQPRTIQVAMKLYF